MPDYESRRQANADEGYERARITIADIEALTDGPLEAVPPVVVRTLAMQLLDVENQIKALGESCVGHVERLAEVEAERDALRSALADNEQAWTTCNRQRTEAQEQVRAATGSVEYWKDQVEAAEARLAGALLILERNLPWERQYLAPVLRGEMLPGEVRADSGEGDRPAEDGPPP